MIYNELFGCPLPMLHMRDQIQACPMFLTSIPALEAPKPESVFYPEERQRRLQSSTVEHGEGVL